MEAAETTFTEPCWNLEFAFSSPKSIATQILLNFRTVTRSITLNKPMWAVASWDPAFHISLCDAPLFQSVQLPVVRPRRQTSRNENSCCDVGMAAQKVWLEQADVPGRRGVGERSTLQTGKGRQTGSLELPVPLRTTRSVVCLCNYLAQAVTFYSVAAFYSPSTR